MNVCMIILKSKIDNSDMVAEFKQEMPLSLQKCLQNIANG